jgi:predicted phage-related endonuclease
MADAKRPFMSYSPDAFCIAERRGVEIKFVNWDQRAGWGDGSTEDDIPMRVVMQTWWYMAGMDFDLWDVFALIGGVPRVWTIHRDREAEKSMLERAEEWHARYILGDDRPAMAGTEEAIRWLQRAYPKHREDSIREATPEEVEMLDTYVTVRAMLYEAEHERKVLECEIKAAIGDDEGLRWPWGKFTWKKCKDSEKVNWQGMATGLLAEYVKDPDLRATLFGIYTKTKPGTRRIHVTHPGLKTEPEEQEQEVSA